MKTEETTAKIAEIIKNRIATENEEIWLHCQIVEALRSFDNKPISKRMATAVQKRLGEEWRVYYQPRYTMYHLEISRTDDKNWYQNKKTFLLGYETNPIFTLANFEKFDNCNGWAAMERNIKRGQDLNRIDELVSKLGEYLAAKEALKPFFDDFEKCFEDHHAIAKEFNIEKGF
jgi:hypothetical protein